MNREEIIQALNIKLLPVDIEMEWIELLADWHIAEVTKAIVKTIRADITFNEFINRPIPIDREYLEREIRKAKRETVEWIMKEGFNKLDFKDLHDAMSFEDICLKIIEENK